MYKVKWIVRYGPGDNWTVITGATIQLIMMMPRCEEKETIKQKNYKMQNDALVIAKRLPIWNPIQFYCGEPMKLIKVSDLIIA